MAGLLRTGAVAFAAGLAGTLTALWCWDASEEYRAKRKSEAAQARAAAEALLPEGRQRDAVRRLMFDPESATFRNERQSKNKPLWWCGEVNAKNRMGGRVGFLRYVVQLEEDPELRDLDLAHIDPSNMDSSGSDRSSQVVEFLAYWRGYCE